MRMIIKQAQRVLLLIAIVSVLVKGQEKNNSPYTLSRDLDMKIAGISAGLLLGSMLIEYTPMDLSEIASLKPGDVPDYDSRAIDNWNVGSIKMSDVLLFSSIAVPGLLMFDQEIRSDYRNFSLVWAQSLFLTLGFTNFTKVLVGRPRPYLYSNNASDNYKLKKDNRKSFFSGHTSVSAVSWFLMASMYEDYRPGSNISPYLWTSAFLVPAYTAYCRYDAGKHFLSDVVAGYLVGSAIGVLVPKWYTKKNNRVNLSFTLQPTGKIKTRLAYEF